MNRSVIDLWVGIFVAVGFGAIIFLALKVGNLLTLDRTPGYRLEASFDNIGGLKLRAPVKAAGVVVGRVEAVRLDPKINTSGLLGEVYIGLDPGGDTVMLKDGERIGKTQSAVVIEKLISQFLFDKASGGVAGEAAAPVKGIEKPAGEAKK